MGWGQENSKGSWGSCQHRGAPGRLYQFSQCNHVWRLGSADSKSGLWAGPHLGFLPHSGTGGGGHEEGGLPGPPVCLRRQVQLSENLSPKGDMRRNALRPEFIRRLENGTTD